MTINRGLDDFQGRSEGGVTAVTDSFEETRSQERDTLTGRECTGTSLRGYPLMEGRRSKGKDLQAVEVVEKQGPYGVAWWVYKRDELLGLDDPPVALVGCQAQSLRFDAGVAGVAGVAGGRLAMCNM